MNRTSAVALCRSFHRCADCVREAPHPRVLQNGKQGAFMGILANSRLKAGPMARGAALFCFAVVFTLALLPDALAHGIGGKDAAFVAASCRPPNVPVIF